MLKNMKRLPMMLLVLILILTAAPINALAAALTSPYTNLSASCDGSGSGSASTGTVSMTVKGARTSDKNGTLTLTNDGTEAAQLSFSYAATGTYSSFTVAGSSAPASGSYSAEIAAGASIKIYLSVSKSGILTSPYSAKVELTNVKLEVASAANVTVSHNGLGTTSVGGNTVASGTTVAVDTVGATFAASPASGAEFVGWINTVDNSVVSTAASFTYVPTGDISLKAIFARPTMEACFWGSAKAYLFESLSAAITHASNASNKTITLAASGTLSSGSYTIPSGVTLLAPFDADGTLYTTSPGYDADNSWKTPSAFRTLTMASGANITVNGAVSVSAVVSAKMGYAGAPTSKYGHIDMNEGSSITVNSGGNLYAWGYITGSGNVTIKSGATVYESFQVVDWRGGTASSGMLGNSKKVFPMTQYYVQNVEAPMTLEYGASEQCSMVADIISVRQVTVQFLGGSGCMFNLTSGTVTKRYDGSTDRLILDVNGEISLSSTEIEMVQYLYYIDLADYVVPLNGNITINVDTGGTLIFNQDASLLPGAEVNIAEGTIVEFAEGKRLFVYDETEWKKEYYVYSSAYFRPVRYAHSKTYTRTADKDIIDAKILVNGTLDASAGYLYTTSSGANICSTANGVVKVQAAEASPTLYEATQSGTSISYSNISIGAAKLKNENGEYVTTSTNTYYYAHHTCEHESDTTTVAHGMWHNAVHTETEVATEPTCTEGGYTTFTCTCQHSYEGTTTEAKGHLRKNDRCSRCGLLCAAMIVDGEYYFTLGEAVSNASKGAHIQMVTNSAETDCKIDKEIYLDLNGCDVTGSVTVTGTLHGMDSKTNGYKDPDSSNTDPYGSIQLSGDPKAVTVYNGSHENDTATMYRYLAVNTTGNTWEFHRFNISVTDYYVEARADGSAAVGFGATFRGNSNIVAALEDFGISINGAGYVLASQNGWDKNTEAGDLADSIYKFYHTAAYSSEQVNTAENKATAFVELGNLEFLSKEQTVHFKDVLVKYYQAIQIGESDTEETKAAKENAKRVIEMFAEKHKLDLSVQ